MPTVHTHPGCVGWYVAGRGVSADAAGTAPAIHGQGVARWADSSGAGNHLTQTDGDYRPTCCAYDAAIPAGGPAVWAPYGAAGNTAEPAFGDSVLFDGRSAWLDVPAAVSLAGGTVVMCTRGPCYAPVTLGGGTTALAYGWMGTTPQRMGLFTPAAGVVPFDPVTFLPTLVPFVHGFRLDPAAGRATLFMGDTQTADVAIDVVARQGGSVGRMIGAAVDAARGPLGFAGEVLELLVFDRPLTDADVADLIARVQLAHAVRPAAAQVVFVGDGLTCGGPGVRPVGRSYPWHLCQQTGGSVKPLVTAAVGHTVADQRAIVTGHVLPLDRSPFAANVAVVCLGSEDVAAGSPPAAVATAVGDLCGDLRSAGFAVVLATVTPRVGYADAIADLNGRLRTVPADALADFASDARLSDPSDATYYADGHHTADAGDAAKANVVRLALAPLLSPVGPPASALTTTATGLLMYGTFYAPGRTLAGRYGRFPRG